MPQQLPFLRKRNGNSLKRLNVTKHSAGISSQMKRQLAQRLNVTKHSAAISSQIKWQLAHFLQLFAVKRMQLKLYLHKTPHTALHPQFCSSEMGLGLALVESRSNTKYK